VAVYEPDRSGPVDDALSLATALGEDGPDLLFSNRISAALAQAAPAGRQAHLVATRRGTVVQYLPDEHAVVEPPRATVPAAVETLIASATALLCRELSEPFPGGRLQRPLTRDGFAALLLDLLRVDHRADIAVVNRGAIDASAFFPLTGALTPLHVNAALPFDNRPMLSRMTGAQVRQWVSSPRAGLFYVQGVTGSGGDVRVNGRPLNDQLLYSVVTTDFVAEGGHGGLIDGMEFVQVGEYTVRDALADFLNEPRTLDPRAALPNPADRTRWVFRYTLDGAFTSTNIANPDARFTDPQLARTPAVTLRIDTEGRADADAPTYTFENGMRLRYGTVSAQPRDAPPTGFNENLDVITGRSTLTLRYLRPEQARWYHPFPFVETYVESELTRPETRTYHHLELRPIAGGRLELFDRFALYAGAGVSWEAFATRAELVPPGNPLVPVLVAGWVLRPRPIFSLGNRVVEADSVIDLVYRDPLGNPGALLRGNLRFSVPVFQAVALTLGYDVFARYDPALGDGLNGVGFSGDALIGLKVSLSRALQAF
ncbi:MAG: 5'-nucleotidase C-terminal domain-containing protein, partial [Myxococcales bacterium]